VTPFERTLFNQGLEALTTGGVGARIPFIQRALESSKEANAQTIAQTSDALSRTRLAGTKFGQTVLANTRQAGNQQTSKIPTTVAEEAIRLVSGLLPGTTSGIGETLRGAAGTAAAGYNTETDAMIAALQAETSIKTAKIGASAGLGAAQIAAKAASDASGAARNRAVGSAVGTAAGAIIGSYVFPGVGTVVGGAAGGAIGGNS
jgi:hypothetical protein